MCLGINSVSVCELITRKINSQQLSPFVNWRIVLVAHLAMISYVSYSFYLHIIDWSKHHNIEHNHHRYNGLKLFELLFSELNRMEQNFTEFNRTISLISVHLIYMLASWNTLHSKPLKTYPY